MPDDAPADRPRRMFLRRAAAFGAAMLAAGLPGCESGGRDAQTRPDGGVQTPTGEAPSPGLREKAAGCRSRGENLSQQSLDVRHALDYTPQTPQEGERCDNCRFYIPPERRSGACGGCDHFAGPVTAGGWCTVWDVERA